MVLMPPHRAEPMPYPAAWHGPAQIMWPETQHLSLLPRRPHNFLALWSEEAATYASDGRFFRQ